MRKKIIAGNWKMNNTAAAAKTLIEELKPLLKGEKAIVVVCPPFTALAAAKKAVKGSRIKLGAQNVSWADSGAFTGEVSADMLIEAGADYVIIGHSERRQYFGETDETVNKRALKALEKGLIPIVCVGETEGQRLGGETESVLTQQLNKGFAGFTEEQALKTVIAYEPVWAIGTGRTATSGDANDTIKFIRKTLKKLFGAKAANKMLIQYGGSMNAKNAAELLAMSDIDGGLIGGASLKAGDFSTIVAAAGIKK